MIGPIPRGADEGWIHMAKVRHLLSGMVITDASLRHARAGP